eukprot:4401234-Lingulodinium_polyedra.AAC.1
MHVWELHAILMRDGWACREVSGAMELRHLTEGEQEYSWPDYVKQFCIRLNQESFEPYYFMALLMQRSLGVPVPHLKSASFYKAL